MKLVRESLFEQEQFKYFRGKSYEQIESALEGLSLKEKFEKL